MSLVRWHACPRCERLVPLDETALSSKRGFCRVCEIGFDLVDGGLRDEGPPADELFAWPLPPPPEALGSRQDGDRIVAIWTHAMRPFRLFIRERLEIRDDRLRYAASLAPPINTRLGRIRLLTVHHPSWVHGAYLSIAGEGTETIAFGRGTRLLSEDVMWVKGWVQAAIAGLPRPS